MLRKMREVVFYVVVMIQVAVFAATRQVIGYGSGDTLDQALFVAQGDAVLNSGAKTTVDIEAGDEKLLGDKGIASNVVFLSKYKILEKGESFDGVYARIQATVCDIKDRVFENGKVLTGSGKGISAKAAKAAAIGDAIMSMGNQVRAVGIYEKEELVKDDAEFTGWAYVTDIEEIDKLEEGGNYTAKVKIKVFANKGASGVNANGEKKVSGRGQGINEAVAVARLQAVLGKTASYVARRTYKTGELYLNLVRRNWRGLCYGTQILGVGEDSDGWRVDLALQLDDNVNSQYADGVQNGYGIGVAKNEADAIEFAKWDAVLNSGAVANIGTTFCDGEFPKERANLTAEGYIGEVNVERITSSDGVVVKVKGPVARQNGNTAECESNDSLGCAHLENSYKSYLLARDRAIINGGAKYMVERKYENNRIVESVSDVSIRRNARSFEVVTPRDLGAGNPIKFRMKSVSDDVGSVYGIGVASSIEEASELARSDAALNFCSDVATEMKYENEQLKESTNSMKGGAYLANCDMTINSLTDGRYMAIAKASAGKDDVSSDKLLNRKAEFGGRIGALMEESICANRRGLFIKSGAMVTAGMDYKNLNLVSSSATYSSKGVLSGCEVDVINAENGQYSSKMTGKVLPLMDDGYRSGIKVFGYGQGNSFDEARKAAVADAAINANSNFSAEEKYENGKYVSGKSQCSAEGYIFDCKVLSNEVSQDGRYVVKMLCDISTARKDELEIAKKKVEVKGWGVSETAAKENAERNAVDAVFGRYVKASLEEVDGAVQSSDSSSTAFENGYIEESKVENVVQKMGLYEVSISAVVRQRGKEDSGWSWITATIVIFILIGIIGKIKNKKRAIAVWLISAISLFATGHWAVALVITFLGLGLFKK